LAIATQQTPLGCGFVSILALFNGADVVFGAATLPPKGVEYPIQNRQKSILQPKEHFEFQGIPFGGTNNPG
jgi:hypothetical protein